MGSYGDFPVVDDAMGGSAIEQHIFSELLVQSVSEHLPSKDVACNVLDSNVDQSSVPGNFMHLSREVTAGSENLISATGTVGDALVGEFENAEFDNDDGSCLRGRCGQSEASNLESGRSCLEGKSQDQRGHEMPPEFMSMNDLPVHFAQQGEQKNEKSNIFLSERDIIAIAEDKNCNAGTLTDACNCISELRHPESFESEPVMGPEFFKSEPLTGFLADCHRQNDQENIKRIEIPVLEVADKCDVLCGMEVDTCKRILPSQNSDVPSEVESMSNQLLDWKDSVGYNSPSEERVKKLAYEESSIGSCFQVLSSQGFQRSLESTCVADLPFSITDLEHGINGSDIDSYAEDVAKGMVQNIDVVNDMVVETENNILPIVGNTCKSKDRSLKSTINCCSSPESGQPSVVFISNGSLIGVPNLLAKDDNGSISSSCTVGDSGLTDNEKKHVNKVDCTTEIKFPNIVSLPSRKNSRGRKSSGCKTQTKRASRKSKKNACVLQSGGDMENIPKVAQKKRSCLSKPARSSVWGLLGNVEGFFEQGNELGVKEVMYQGFGKAIDGCHSGKTKNNIASSNSLSVMPNCCASTTCLRLRIRVGKKLDLSYSRVLIPEVIDGTASASYSNTGSDTLTVDSNVESKLAEELAVGKLESLKNSLDKDACVANEKTANGHLETTVMIDKSDGDVEERSIVVCPEAGVAAMRKPINIKGMDPETSPDSEVINSIPEVQDEEGHQEDMHDAGVDSFREFISHVDVSGSKREKTDKTTCSSNCNIEDGSQDQPGANKAKHPKCYGRRKNPSDAIFLGESFTISSDKNTVSNSSISRNLSTEPLLLSEEAEFGACSEALEVRSSLEVEATCSPPVDNGMLVSQGLKDSQPCTTYLGRKLPQSLKSIKVSKTKSRPSDLTSNKKTASRCKEKLQEPVIKCKVKGKGVSGRVMCEVNDSPRTENRPEENQRLDGVGKINAVVNRLSVDGSNLDNVGLGEQQLLLPNAWVLCDNCHKWRRISAALADQIGETNCTWTCKDSNDKAFADCSIPQEKSNAEINAELGLSDEDAYEDCKNYKELDYRCPIVSQDSTFTCIFTNEFLHRSHKSQTIDEIMVCHCKPPPPGQLGCGDECLNRMLNIECVQGTCPCGDLCSNQQFQKRNYASLEWFKCGKKGYGLKALEDISKGQFLIEYVGEVLDMPAYEERQREYALKGHRHFYFMTLNGSEVIDASAKGNLGRFINHSCDPNCRTEKWMVNGEICVGLFALRDIKQDEEVTFDYNYVRVFGAAARKCYCGSPHCRGYIGGDPHNSEILVQGDSDEEFPEPVMLTKDGQIKDSRPKPDYFDNFNAQVARQILKDRDRLDKSAADIVQDGAPEKESSMNLASVISQLHSSSELEGSNSKLPSSAQVEPTSQQMEDLRSKSRLAVLQGCALEAELLDKTSSLIERVETSSSMLVSEVLSNFLDSNRVENQRGFSESQLIVKTSQVKGSVKKGRIHANLVGGIKVEATTKKLQVPSLKVKKVAESTSNRRFEAVQEKLNEVLDGDGGISKRKDATKGYLKLLLLTAASDDRSNGEAIQSNRDLSMVLDALLKTKSRAVLNDIVNKNGLQMLHNVMKQCRRDFKKIPILRKLLKVLEFLAASKILTLEHIISSPPCPGMESFRNSMLSLTEHDDKQVHQIARSFRDKWIPRPIRKFSYMDRNDLRVEPHKGVNCDRFSASLDRRHEQDMRPTEAINCIQQSMLVTTSVDSGAQKGCSAPMSDGCEMNGTTKRRKRKSRWDQPAETSSDGLSYPHKEQKIDSLLINGRQNIAEHVPPGFSCLFQNAGHSLCPDAVFGHPKMKFNSLLPVSYGMPLSIVQQHGTPHAEIAESWVTAPGMPFNPFPPLPPCPHPWDKKNRQPVNTTDAATIDQLAESGQCDNSSCYLDGRTRCTTSTNPDDLNCTYKDNDHISKRAKGSSFDLGKRYFRQRKWNNSKSLPWLRNRNAWGCNGNNFRNGMCSIGVVNVPNELKVSCYSDDAVSGGDKSWQ